MSLVGLSLGKKVPTKEIRTKTKSGTCPDFVFDYDKSLRDLKKVWYNGVNIRSLIGWEKEAPRNEK